MCLYPTFIVVIRFQICIFDILNTALIISGKNKTTL